MRLPQFMCFVCLALPAGALSAAYLANTRSVDGRPYAGQVEEVGEAEKHAGETAVKDLRYDGRSFDEWRKYMQNEIKPERRADGFKAFAVFASYGLEKKAAKAIAAAVKKQDVQLRPAHDDKLTWPCAQAAESLVCIGSVSIPILAEVINDHPCAEVRWWAVFTLEELQTTDAVGSLVMATNDKSSMVRWAAFDTLAHSYGGDEATKALRSELNTDGKLDRFVAAACRTIEELQKGDSAVPEYLPTRLVSDDIAEVLGRLGPKAKLAIPTLRSALKKGNGRMIQTSVPILLRIGAEPKSIAELLIEVVDDELKMKPQKVVDDELKMKPQKSANEVPPPPPPAKENSNPEEYYNSGPLVYPSRGFSEARNYRLQVAIVALGDLGAAARSAIPTLKRVLLRGDRELDAAVNEALTKIESKSRP